MQILPRMEGVEQRLLQCIGHDRCQSITKNSTKKGWVLPNRRMIIHCYPHHVAVGISSGRNSMKANSRIIREINKPMLKAEKKWRKKTVTHQELNEALSSVVSIVMPSLFDKPHLDQGQTPYFTWAQELVSRKPRKLFGPEKPCIFRLICI